jgi:hypothetical protein
MLPKFNLTIFYYPPVDPAGNMLDPGWYWQYLDNSMAPTADPQGPFETVAECAAALAMWAKEEHV